MDADRKINSYTWHQSHDQATVLLLVPYETLPEDVVVVIEQNFLVAGVRGQPPIIKGQLYGNVDTASSVWQLEPRASARGRTTSTTSTVSTQSSYAYVSDPETSSSIAASVESGHASENDEPATNSPAMSLPPSRDEQLGFGFDTAHHRTALSHLASPGAMFSHFSSFSSVDSLHWTSGRLLTLHLEKGESIIWPSLITGSVPETISPIVPVPGPSNPSLVNLDTERKYNMDPTSLGLMAEDLYDIRNDKQGAFECFIRAWRQAHTPLSTLRLVTHYLPVQLTLPPSDSPSSQGAGSTSYYLDCVGGPEGLAQLYLDAGLLYLEGAATALMSPSYSALSSIRTVESSHTASGGTAAWRRDRECARRYFDRARALYPRLDVPMLSLEGEDLSPRRQPSSSRESSSEQQLRMPSIDIHASNAAVNSATRRSSGQEVELESTLRPRKRRKDDTAGEDSMIQQAKANDTNQDDEDNAWYLYLPGLIGAGTALLVVGVVSALSFSSWRKQQG